MPRALFNPRVMTTPALSSYSLSQTHLMKWIALGVLLAFSAFIKYPVWQLAPQIFNDTTGYLVPAVSVLDGRGYGAQENGFRTPTYPLYLALVLAPFNHTALDECRDAHRTLCLGRAAQTADGRIALRTIVLTHVLLGLGVTVLLYALGWQLTRNVFVALMFGAGYALNLATAYWEVSLLTETLTTFLLVVSVYLTFRIARTKPNGWNSIALGFVLGALALCHSLFLIFGLLPATYLLIDKWRKKTRTLSNLIRLVAPILLIPVLFILLWSSFNYVVNGSFTPSTLSGYVLIQMVTPVVQNAPEGYDGLTQIYIGYRDAMIEQTGSYSNAIFQAWPAMLQASNLTWSALSRRLTELSLYLIVAYPQSYLNVVSEGWSRFWDFAIYNYLPVPEGQAQWVLGFTDANVQQGLNILFWLSLPALGTIYWLRRGSHARIPFAEILFLGATILFAALVVALTTFGDNSRYHSYVLPFQYGVIVSTLWAMTCTAGQNRVWPNR